MDKENKLTLERLRELLHYDADTGTFSAKAYASVKRPGKVGYINSGYYLICIDSVPYRAHRLAWFYHYEVWPTGIIDHINGDKLDNRIVNLRDTDYRGNASNMKKHREGGLIGTYYNRKHRCWVAQICWNKLKWSLGSYETEEMAHAAYINELNRLKGGGEPVHLMKARGHLLGARFDKRSNTWYTMVKLVNGKRISVWGFQDKEAAHAGYLRLMGAEDKKAMAEQMRAEIRKERGK